MTRAALLLPLALAACNQPAAPAGNTAAPAEHGYIAKVRALPPGQQQIVLYRAIQSGGGSSGQACQAVEKVEPFPPARNGEPIWRVTCDRGAQFLVQLQDDGMAVVTSARE